MKIKSVFSEFVMGLTGEEKQLLVDKLDGCSKEAKDFVQPLLGMEAAHEVLKSFAMDETRSFEDWIWEPAARQVLQRLRNMKDNSSEKIDNQFEQVTTDINGGERDVMDVFDEAKSLRDAAKAAFGNQNMYSALSKYKKAEELLQCLLTDASEQRKEDSSPIEDTADQKQTLMTMDDAWYQDIHELYLATCTSIAVVALKEQKAPLCREYARKVYAQTVRFHPKFLKAMYCECKSYLLEHRYDESRSIAKKALEIEQENVNFVRLLKDIDRTEHKMKSAKCAEPLTIVPLDKKAKKRAEKAKFKIVPLPSRKLNDAELMLYFNRWRDQSKAKMSTKFDNVTPPGELCKFQCTFYFNEVEMSQAVASSKKKAEVKAARGVLEKLWQERIKDDTLLPQDMETMGQDELKQDVVVAEDSVPKGSMRLEDLRPIELYTLHRSLHPTQQLGYMEVRHGILVRYEYIDLTVNDDPQFECHAIVNDEVEFTSIGRTKKAARHVAVDEVVKFLTSEGPNPNAVPYQSK